MDRWWATEAFEQAQLALLTQVGLGRFILRHIENRQVVAFKAKIDIAALGDQQGIVDGWGTSVKIEAISCGLRR